MDQSHLNWIANFIWGIADNDYNVSALIMSQPKRGEP